jgi:hypothetical protein
MSYLLTKRLAECTQEEKAYKRAYTRHIKTRMVERIGKENYHRYNSNYGKQYYQMHKDKLRERARKRKAELRGVPRTAAASSRGRPSTLGITVTAI